MPASVEAWRRRWKKFQRMMRRKRRHVEALREILFAVALGTLIDGIIILGIVVIGQYRLLDVRTIVSVVLPDVGIAIILYYLLGQKRRERLGEIADIIDSYAKVSHLRVFTFPVLGVHFYYVENTITKEAYQASEFIIKIIDEGILKPVDCKDEREMKRILRKNKTKLSEREPELAELLNPNGYRYTTKAKAQKVASKLNNHLKKLGAKGVKYLVRRVGWRRKKYWS